MQLLAVLLVALAAMELSGTSADEGECLCYFPDKMEGRGFIELAQRDSITEATLTRFLYIVNRTLGRVAFWMRRHYFYRSENPDYIMDLKADLLYKLERRRDVPCTKAKLPEEWRLPNCFPSGLSFRSTYPSGEYLYSNQDNSRKYIMYQDQNNFTKEEPCTFSAFIDNKHVTDGERTIFFSSREKTGKNPEKVALDLSSCTARSTLNSPFHPGSYYL